MKDLFQGDKRGISAMIGYVLLVVIGITLAVLVYGFLKVYVPSDKAVCPDNVALSIEEFSCFNGAVKVRLGNRGLFKVDGAYIRIGEEGRVFRQLLNEDNIFFDEWASEEGLPPGEFWPKTTEKSYAYAGTGQQILEVEPVIFVDDELTLCSSAVITQPVVCSEGEYLLNVELIEPTQGGIYYDNEIIDVQIDVNGAVPESCSYNVTDTNDNEVIPDTVFSECGLGIKSESMPFSLEEGQYRINVWAIAEADKSVDSDSFEVLRSSSNTVEINLQEPSSNLYEFRDTMLNIIGHIPIQYTTTNAVTCKVNITDPFGVLKYDRSGAGLCGSISDRLLRGLFLDEGIYRLEVWGVNDENEWNGVRKSFGVLVNPDIDILGPSGSLPNGQCSPVLDYDFTVRRYPIIGGGKCEFYLYNETGLTGYREFPDCNPTGEAIGNMRPGNYRIEGFINDTDNPRNGGTDVTNFQVSGTNCQGYGGGGGWVIPL